MSETRNQRLLREFNEKLDRDRGILKGMSADEKRVLGYLIFAAALIANSFTLAFAGTSEFEMDITCVDQRCTVDKKQLAKLIAHNNAVTRKLQGKCNSLSDI